MHWHILSMTSAYSTQLCLAEFCDIFFSFYPFLPSLPSFPTLPLHPHIIFLFPYTHILTSISFLMFTAMIYVHPSNTTFHQPPKPFSLSIQNHSRTRRKSSR